MNGKVDDTIKASNMIRTNDRTYDTTGKGVLTQVFVDNTKKEITIAELGPVDQHVIAALVALGYIAGVREFEGTKNYLFLAAYDGTGSHMGIKTRSGSRGWKRPRSHTCR